MPFKQKSYNLEVKFLSYNFLLNLLIHFILNITFISHYYSKYYNVKIGQIIFIFFIKLVFFIIKKYLYN